MSTFFNKEQRKKVRVRTVPVRSTCRALQVVESSTKHSCMMYKNNETKKENTSPPLLLLSWCPPPPLRPRARPPWEHHSFGARADQQPQKAQPPLWLPFFFLLDSNILSSHGQSPVGARRVPESRIQTPDQILAIGGLCLPPPYFFFFLSHFLAYFYSEKPRLIPKLTS